MDINGLWVQGYTIQVQILPIEGVYFSAVRELGIELTKSLDVSISVRGMTKLRNEIYVLCRSNDRSQTVICAYQDDTPFDLLSKFKII